MMESEGVFSQAIREHFLHPKNVGEIPDADGVGAAGDPRCGDYLKVWIKVQDLRIVDIRFKCRGCPAAIACSSAMTELAKGKNLDEAAEITPETIEEALGGLPEGKRHCSNLGADALYEAIMSYIFSSLRPPDRNRQEMGREEGARRA